MDWLSTISETSGRRRVRAVTSTFIILISLAAGLIATHAMRWGPAAGSDSAEYFEAARNLVNGDGLVLLRASGKVVPMTLRPPFYSVLLALGSLLGLSLIATAKILDVLLLMGFIVIFGVSVQILLRSSLLALSVVILALSAPAILMSFTEAMSEPLFLVLSVASFFSVAYYLQAPERRFVLVMGAIFAGFALLTRFFGIATLLASVFGLLVLENKHWKGRAVDGLIFLLIGISPMAIWLAKLLGAGDHPGIYNLPSESLWSATAPVRGAILNAIWNWTPFGLLVDDITYVPRLILLVSLVVGSLFVVVILIRWRGIPLTQALREPAIHLTVLFASFAVIYAIFLTATYVVVSVPRPAFVERIMLPIPFAGFLSLIFLLFFIERSIARRPMPGLFPLALAVVVTLGNLQTDIDTVVGMNKDGRGLTSQEWQTSETIAALRELPDGLDIVSNQADVILLFLERSSFGIPELETEQRAAEFLSFGEYPSTMAERVFREQGAVLVLFSTAYQQFQAIYGPDASRRLESFSKGLRVYSTHSDGTIYFWEESAPP